MGDLLADRADSDRVRPDSAPIRPPSGAGGAPFPEARHRGRKGYTIVYPQTNRKGPLQGLPPRTVPRIDPAHAMAHVGQQGRPVRHRRGLRRGLRAGGSASTAATGWAPRGRLSARRRRVEQQFLLRGRSPNMLRQPVKRGSSGAAGVGVDRTVAGGAQRPRQGAPFRAAHHGECCRVPLARRALPSRAPSRTCSRARSASASRS